jgi:uncharacterized protein YdaU (DUF1376 family)
MAKEKDPAFLFYPKDWLQGTSKLMPEEKGVYIDLLAHQHQDGKLPNDIKRLARMVGMSEPDFLQIWATLKVKFVQTNDNHLVNQKLTKVSTKRESDSKLKKIAGTFASIIRTSKIDYAKKQEIKKLFNTNDFVDCAEPELYQVVTNWFVRANQSIAIAIENGIVPVMDIKEVKEFSKNEDFSHVYNAGYFSEQWNHNPSDEEMNLQLDPVKGGAVIELFKFTKNYDLTDIELAGLWSIFKKQNFTGKKFYQSKNDAFSHFINWSKTQNIQKNGTETNRQFFTGAANNAGESKSRIAKAKKW